eukprot:TRINITY_DN3520_c0_g1_i1.p1 TRINITY_DN3520_c0_g1~~TRINITY_DN3520_c0_g1_i1.p1  ORF type:complete len:526 (+),score=89.09 TRINITY_DN3520_c0_g1_i1:156-1733(+)
MGGCSAKEFREGTAKDGTAHVTRHSALQRQATAVILREHKKEETLARKESLRHTSSMRKSVSLRDMRQQSFKNGKRGSSQRLLEHRLPGRELEIMSTACPDEMTDAVGAAPSEFTSGNMKADNTTLAYSLPDGSTMGGSMGPEDGVVNDGNFSSCDSDSLHLECESKSLSAMTALNVSDYEIIRKLDAGRFAVIWRARPFKSDPDIPQQVAIKILAPRAMQQTSLRELVTEVVHMRAVHHENVVELFKVELDDTSPTCWLIQELVLGSNLKKLLMANHGSGLPEETCKSIIIQLIKGLSAIHASGISHGSICCEHVILTPNGVIKICDFGRSREIHSRYNKQSVLTTDAQQYCSPELRNPEVSRPDGVKGDVYAAGVVLFVCLTAKFPFKNTTGEDGTSSPPASPGSCGTPSSTLKMRRLHAGTSPEATNLLIGMLDPSPATRFNLLQVAAHTWIGTAVPLVTTRVNHKPSLRSEKAFAFNRVQAWFNKVFHNGSPARNNPLDEDLGDGDADQETFISKDDTTAF